VHTSNSSTAAPPVGEWLVPADAVEILPPDASRTDYDAWCDARMAGIGGSDIPALLGLVRWESAFGLWLTKTGRRPPIPDNGRMERGRYLEPSIAQYFADKTGIACRRTGTWARIMWDAETQQFVPGWERCNPDRLTADGGVLEIKAPDVNDWGDHWGHGPALHAVAQLMWTMGILGAPHGYVAADGADGLRWWRVEFDKHVYGWMRRAAGAWFYRHVLDDDPPDVDRSDATTTALKQASLAPDQLADRVFMPGATDLARERRALKERIKDLTGELTLVENLFRAALRTAKTAVDPATGLPVLSWEWAALNSTKQAPYRAFKEPK
jgi:predicted phage-related endonuclease